MMIKVLRLLVFSFYIDDNVALLQYFRVAGSRQRSVSECWCKAEEIYSECLVRVKSATKDVLI